MSKKIQMVLLVLLSTLIVTGCSSDKKSKTSQSGNVVFFHNIENAGELQLKAVNTTQRNSYGVVDFQQFSSMIYLTAQSWGVDVVDNGGTTATGDDVTVLDNGSFSVPANGINIVALTGTYATSATADLTLHQLKVAKDTETSDDNAENIQYINVMHLHKDVAAVDVYILSDEVSGTEDPANLASFTPVATNLAFGKASANIRLENTSHDYYIYVTEADNPTNVLNEAGKRELLDYVYQSLLISPNYNAVKNSDITLFYYTSGGAEHWNDTADWTAQVRALNAVGAASIDVEATSVLSGATAISGSTLAGGDVSDYVDLDSDTDTYLVKASSGGTSLSPGVPVYPSAGEKWTVIFYGDDTTSPETLQVMKTLEDQAVITARASITVSNAGYFPTSEDAKSFDVHILRSGQAFNASSPVFSAMLPGSYSRKRYAADNYQIFVTEAGTEMVYAVAPAILSDGEHYHFVIVGDIAKGFRVCELDETANTCDGY